MSLPRARTDTGPDNQEWLEEMVRLGDAYLVAMGSNTRMPEDVLERALKRTRGAYVQLLQDLAGLGKL